MRSPPLFLVLTLVLLLGRVGCAWGWMADPCCKATAGHAGEVVTLHDGTTAPAPEPTADHALHAGHCHCVFQMADTVVVDPPPRVATAWPPHMVVSPAGPPRAIEYPPEVCS